MSRIGGKVGTRPTYQDLGLSMSRVREIQSGCRNGTIDRKTMTAACSDFQWLSDFLIMAAETGRSFDKIEFCDLGRVPCGRSNFYAFRRRFYKQLDILLRNNRKQI